MSNNKAYVIVMGMMFAMFAIAGIADSCKYPSSSYKCTPDKEEDVAHFVLQCEYSTKFRDCLKTAQEIYCTPQ